MATPNDFILNPDTDPFRPPEIPTEVGCIHCQKTYESYLIEWRVFTEPDGKRLGFWMCPTPNCDGKGFLFDILPTDPKYQSDRGGWVDDESDDDFEDVEFDESEG